MHRYFKLTLTLAAFLASAAIGLSIPSLARASLYRPGETTNPDCAPGSSSCGVMNTVLTQGGNNFGAAASLGTNDNYPLYLRANSSTAMTILPTGSVGIGTTAPASALHIETSATDAVITVNAQGGNTPAIDLWRSGSRNAIIGVASGNGSLTPGTTAGDLVVRTQSNDLFFSQDGGSTSHVVIKSNGNVGIGTTTPAATFTLQGAAGVNPFTIASSGATLLTVTPSGNFGLGTTSPQSTLTIQGSDSVNPFTIASSSGATLLTLTPSGNLTLGTTLPTGAPSGTFAANVIYSPNGALNVKAFGASCDGSTDDTLRLAAWLAAGKQLYIPPGAMCKFTSTLTIPSETTIFSDNAEGTTAGLLYVGTDARAILISNVGRITLRNFTITGQNQTVGLEIVGGADTPAWFIHLEGLKLTGFSTALSVGNTSSVQSIGQQIRITNSTFSNNQHGIALNKANIVKIDRSSFFANTGTAIILGTADANPIYGAWKVTITDSSIELPAGTATAAGIVVLNGTGITIDGIYAELDSTTGPLLNIPNTSIRAQGVTFRNSYINASFGAGVNPASYPIRIDRSDGVVTVYDNVALNVNSATAFVQNTAVKSLVLFQNDIFDQTGAQLPEVNTGVNAVSLWDVYGQSGIYRNSRGVQGRITAGGARNMVRITASDTLQVGDSGVPVSIQSGGTVVYRCATAGTLPLGALTVTVGDCGSTTDTGLRVP